MKKFNPTNLPYIAALAQTTLYGHAGYILIGWVGVLIGGIIGAVVSFSVAYAGSQIASLRGTKRSRLAALAMFALITVSPLALVVPLYISFDTIQTNHARVITAAMWASAPDLAILLSGLVTGKKMVAEINGETLKPAKQAKPKTPKSLSSAKPSEPPAFICDWCGETKTQKGKPFANVQQVSGHKAHCEKRPNKKG